MRLAFVIVAVILFAIDFLAGVVPNSPVWSRSFSPLGLAFWAASNIVPG